MRPRVFFIIVICVFAFTASAQFSRLDSSRNAVYNAPNPQQKLKALLQIFEHVNMMPGDSINHFTNMLDHLARQLKDTFAISKALHRKMNVLISLGDNKRLIDSIDNGKDVQWVKKYQPDVYYRILLVKANALNRLDRRTAALDLQLQLLNYAQKNQNVDLELFVLNYLGATYFNLGDNIKAQQYWEDGIATFKKNPSGKHLYIYSNILGNLGKLHSDNYIKTKNFAQKDSAFSYLNQALVLSKSRGDMSTYAWNLTVRGLLYVHEKQHQLAEADLSQAQEILEKIGDPLYIAHNYNSQAINYTAAGIYEKAESILLNALAYCKAKNQQEPMLELMQSLANLYNKQKNYKAYAETLEQINRFKDSSGKVNAADKILELEAAYESQKSKATIAGQKVALLQRRIWLAALTGLIVLLAAGGLLWYRINKRKQQIKLDIVKKEEALKKQVAILDAEEKERKRIAADLHDNLGVQANAILHNATQLTVAGVNEPEQIAENLQHLSKEMLFNLRETLWAMKSEHITAESLWMRVINLTTQLNRQYKHIDFSAEGEAPDLSLDPNKALHILMIVQEAVNNALRHSGGDKIILQSNFSYKLWQLSVMDNGKGIGNISAQNEQSGHFGMANMQARAKQLEAVLSFPPTNEGTTLLLQMPL